jgi:lipoprotein-releasing system permease protein
MTYLYIAAGFVFDVFVTWVLGLCIPLVVQAILRRPLRKVWALVLTGILWLLNYNIFTFLGSQSRTHAALFLVAATTYWILYSGTGPQAFLRAVHSLLVRLLWPTSIASFLWLKYLRKRRIVFLSIAAVALSVALLIVVASLFTGFINAFERSAVEMLGDVVIAGPPGRPIEKYPALIERLEQLDIVEAATGTLSSQGLLHVGTGNVRPVSLWGIEAGARARVTGFQDALLRQRQSSEGASFAVPGAPDAEGGFVGIGVVAEADPNTDEYDQAAVLEQMIGQRVVITTGTPAEASDADQTPKRKLVPFHIADIVFTGVHDLDTGFVYVPIETLQKVLYPDKDSPATTVNIKLKPGIDPMLAVAEIRGLWDVFAERQLGWSEYLRRVATEIVTAREMQRQYVEELRKQMGVLLLIFGVVSFTVVVLVFCIFYMIVRLKQRDIAILKSCGAASISVAWIFLGFGITVGVVGAAIGAVGGYAITKNINAIEEGIRVVFGLKLWSSSVYMFTRIPSEVDWASALPIVALAIGAAAVGALTPAIVAAMTRPVEVLRYE